MSQPKVLIRSRKKKAFACVQEGRLAEAKAIYQEICRADSRDAEAWFLLGAVNGQLGNFDETIACCQKAVALVPDYVDAHYNLAQAYMHQQRLEQAVAAYRQVIRLRPDHADAHNSLGLALEALGHHDEALECYRKALRIQPTNAEACNNLGAALRLIGGIDEAVECFRQALRHRPDFVLACLNLGFALQQIGRIDEAREAFDRARALNPDNPDVIFGMAAVHEKKGEFEQAYSLLRPFLDAGTENIQLALVYGRVARHVDQQSKAIAMIERHLENVGSGPVAQPLHFQLGKLYDATKEYDQAFSHFHRANSLVPIRRDPEEHLRMMDAIMAQFTPEFIERAPRTKNLSERPIFIVGMPRSGTSLTEQILASHPSVYGAGELNEMGKIVQMFQGMLGSALPYPQCLDKLDQKVLDIATERYLSKLEKLSPDAACVTDKMPHNFKHLGLIALMFPGAHIIHCRRDPLDTCLSIFTLEFNAVHSYATDLRHLGEHYRKYRQIMDHWKHVLPIPIFEMQYEELTADPERVIRELVAFCGLEWDDRCLHFHETKRVVNTFSYDQVRRPIYKKSVARWKRYERHLGPLKEALGMPPNPPAESP